MTTTPRRVVTATLATLALAGAVAPGAGAAANPPAAPAAPTFNTVKLPDAGGGTEPRITVAPDGKRYVITNAGDAVVYTSTDGGQTWKQVTKPGGQTSPTIDVDIIAAHNGRLLASELDLAGINFPTSYSDDGGQTWTAALGSTNLVDQDRQWFAFGPDDPSTGKPRAYLLYHNLGSGAIQHNMWVATSTDGGETFGP
ncbi:MAG: repeat-like domain, partial [Solirubrobacteraceae bacterium]|nr:repeat-like domain [Solirubrobacteraceae bacterium]